MADVKQARLLARPIVRIDDGQVTVLHWHLVASKGHEAGAMLRVKLVEPRPTQLTLSSGRRGEADLARRSPRQLASAVVVDSEDVDGGAGLQCSLQALRRDAEAIEVRRQHLDCPLGSHAVR